MLPSAAGLAPPLRRREHLRFARLLLWLSYVFCALLYLCTYLMSQWDRGSVRQSLRQALPFHECQSIARQFPAQENLTLHPDRTVKAAAELLS